MLLIIIVGACYGFGAILLICETGQRLSNAFEELGERIKTFDWYVFPLEIQRMLPVLLMAAHQEIVLECFGSIAGTRQTFKKVSLCQHFLKNEQRSGVRESAFEPMKEFQTSVENSFNARLCLNYNLCPFLGN